MKREELESLEWRTGEDEGANGSGGPFLYAPEIDDEEGMKLAAAAPALALACIEARLFVLTLLSVLPEHRPTPLLGKLETALAAAGVEVSDGD